jgi:hypothetical protein
VELIQVRDIFVHPKRFPFAIIQAHGQLALLRVHLFNRPGILVDVHLVNGLRLVVLLLLNGPGPRSKQ